MGLDTLSVRTLRSGRNQKLTDSQIATIKYLREEGYSTIVIARLARQMYGIGLSTTYYHCQTIDPEYLYRRRMQQLIRAQIEKGYTTREISEEWKIPLVVINKLYVG